MIFGIYQSLIIHILFLFHVFTTDTATAAATAHINAITAVIGTDGIVMNCSFISNVNVLSVRFYATNDTTNSFVAITDSSGGYDPTLLPYGEYLFGSNSTTISKLTQTSTSVVLTFNELKCKHERSYKCQLTVSGGVVDSEPEQIIVTVPPSKPNSISFVHTPAEPSLTSTKHEEDSTSSPSTTVTSIANETVSASQTEKHNNTSAFNHSTIQTTGHNTKTSTPSHNEDSFNINYRTTTYSIQQTTTAQGIAEGDNITVVCTGDVGKPPAKHVFEKYLNGKIVPMLDTTTTSSIPDMLDNCSYYRTSNITFQVTAKDNNAVIRCVVNSSMTEPNMYVETAPIEVYYEVSMPSVTKYPNKTYYVVGEDTSIHLTCKSDGNPQPDYYWYKENSDNPESTSENLTITVMNNTNSEVYTCNVSNTFNGSTYTRSAKVQVYVKKKADTSTLPSSSTGSSSGTDEKSGNPTKDQTPVYIGVCAALFVVLLVVLGCYLFKRKRKGKDESAENNGSTNSLMHCNSKYVGESRPGAYDSVALEGNAPVISSGKKEQNAEDVRKHNEEYMKKQKNEEKIENKSPTSHQPVIYAKVNEATKSKYRQTIETQDSSNQQEDDTYAGTQEGVYDQSGDRRHKVNENAEQFDTVGDIKKRNSTDGIESTIQSSQKGSYVNQAFNKGEKRQVATVPPISRSSGGSQGDEQTSEINAKRSQKGYENVKGTDNTHTSDALTINQTSL